MNYVTLMNAIVLSNNILNSIFGQGAKNFINDLIPVLQLIGGLIVIVLFIVASIKKSKEDDEQGRKRYTGGQISLAVLLVMILGAKEFLTVILQYFGLSFAS